MELGHRTVKSGQFGVIWEAERQPKSTGLPSTGTALAAACRGGHMLNASLLSLGEENKCGLIPRELRCESCLPLFETRTRLLSQE